MFELTTYFIISQILVFIAMGFDLLSYQFKKREHIILCLIISSVLICTHYFFLDKIAAGVIMIICILRLGTSYFTTNKKFLFLFIGLSTISLFFTYKEWYDFILYFGTLFFIIGCFQKEDKLMRKLMMIGTVLMIVYNAIIFTPMGVVTECVVLSSNFVGYYRHYIKKGR